MCKPSRRPAGMLLTLTVCLMCVAGCSRGAEEDKLLDPTHPVSVTIWHYHNGVTKRLFDSLVDTFNATVGKERGIFVDAMSQGDITQLADSIYASSRKQIGSSRLPDICGLYPDNALRVNGAVPLVDLETFFSRDELALFNGDFLEDGRIGPDNTLLILPVSKSTENLFLNKTDWDRFSDAAGISLDSLNTWQGICRAAELYYNWTDAQTPRDGDGAIFFGVDAVFNYILMLSKQTGSEMFVTENGRRVFCISESLARSIWNLYHVPSVKGYFGKVNRYCSDDLKTGVSLAYVGSTAGAGYFPDCIRKSLTEIYPVQSVILPYPVYECGKAFAPLRGAGMSIISSDRAHEYASAVFLKWFTAAEQNVLFSAATGYMPVHRNALNRAVLLSATRSASEMTMPVAVEQSITATLDMVENYTLYSEKPVDGMYELRSAIEAYLQEQIDSNRAAIERSVTAGAVRAKACEERLSEDAFYRWYAGLTRTTAGYIE